MQSVWQCGPRARSNGLLALRRPQCRREREQRDCMPPRARWSELTHSLTPSIPPHSLAHSSRSLYLGGRQRRAAARRVAVLLLDDVDNVLDHLLRLLRRVVRRLLGRVLRALEGVLHELLVAVVRVVRAVADQVDDGVVVDGLVLQQRLAQQYDLLL